MKMAASINTHHRMELEVLLPVGSLQGSNIGIPRYSQETRG